MHTYQFVKFDGFFSRGDTKIAIHRSGVIRLSSGFCRLAQIQHFNHAVLFYDKRNNAIAIQFTKTWETGAVKITNDRTGAAIAGTAFMKKNNLDIKNYARRYDWKKESIPSIGKVYIIDLVKNETFI